MKWYSTYKCTVYDNVYYGLGSLSPRYADSVFIFGSLEDGVFMPTGTCFAVSDEYLLTAQHNMDKRKLVGYGIAVSVSKTNDVQEAPEDFHRVKIKYYNVQSDWAIIELLDPPFTERTVPIPITTVDVEMDTDFKVFHMPISEYMFQETDSISAHTDWLKAGRPKKHHVEGNKGLFRGSSGAPFVLRNGYAFAMHLESRNEAISVPEGKRDDAEVISNTIHSNAQVHASRCSGLYLKTCSELLSRLLELGVRIIN